MVPLVYSTLGSTTFPFSMDLLTSNAVNIMAQEINTEASAKCKPVEVGQIHTCCITRWHSTWANSVVLWSVYLGLRIETEHTFSRNQNTSP